jgi:8-oxo-dGTP pyrophosphatase MutT (NUDIX family)
MPEAVASIPVRDAATVILVRDADTAVADRDASGSAGFASDPGRADEPGIEVFMLRRNLQSDFVGGAYVFPGGAVDEADRLTDLEPVCTGRSDADASHQLGIERGGLAFWVAAIRECFEEAGVLLADDLGGEFVTFADPDVDARFRLHRKAVDTRERRLVEICAQEQLQLAVGAMYYFSHWITPVGPTRRYDTRFFVARAPEGQVPLHDDGETIANLWIRPSDALARHKAGDYQLVFPTMRSLVALERFATADEVLAAVAAIEHVPTILPKIIEDTGGYRIILPGDDGYDDAIAARLPAGVPISRVPISRVPMSDEPISSVQMQGSGEAAGGRA